MPEGTYTHGHHDSVLRSHRWRTAENSAAYLLPHLRPGLDLLDVGCGPGTITADLATLVAPGHRAARRPADVIDAARRTAAERGVDIESRRRLLWSRRRQRRCRARIRSYSISPIRWPRRRVAACRRLAAGRATRDYSAFTWYPANPCSIAGWSLTKARRERRRDAGRMLPARTADDVTTTASVWCFAHEPDRTWWADLWADRISISALADQLRAENRATTDELHAIAEAWRRWATHPDAFFIVPHAEILARSGPNVSA
jgi:SAM-dependent methyltransferase